MTTLGLFELKKVLNKELKGTPVVKKKDVRPQELRQSKSKKKPVLMTLVFDMDGTLTEPWYGKHSPLFYINDTDAVVRSLKESTYAYVKPLPYVVDFLKSCKEYYGEGYVEFKNLTRIMNGKEYQDKVVYTNDYFGDFDFEVLGAVSEEDKLIYLSEIAEKSRVIYFDDTLSTLNKVNNLDTKHFILGCHSTAMLTRKIEELDKAWYMEQLERENLI